MCWTSASFQPLHEFKIKVLMLHLIIEPLKYKKNEKLIGNGNLNCNKESIGGTP